MNEKRSVLLIGGPDAGKSNYLFRLWLAISHGTGILVSDGMPDDLEYLRTGADALLRGRFAPRTSKEVHNCSFVPVKSAQGMGQLIVPDCSGEKWLEIYDKREWSPEWEELISHGTGCLLFVRAGSEGIVHPLDWITCYEEFGSARNPEPQGDEGGSVTADAQPEPERRTTPTQVLLVDWLQFLRRVFIDHVGGSFRPRIGVVVAAWDAVPAEQQSGCPLQYIASNFPLFAQFLRANSSAFDVQGFGVSVAGGDFDNEPGFRDRFLSLEPQAAGYVVHTLDGNRSESPDHTLPVAWALGLMNGTEPSAR